MSFLFQISEGFPGDFLLLVPDLIPLRLGHVLRILRRELWPSTQSVPRWPQARSGAVCLCPAGWGVCAEVAPGALGGSVSLPCPVGCLCRGGPGALGRSVSLPCPVGCLCVSGLAGCSVVHVFSVSPDFLTSCSVQLSSIGYLHLRCLIFSFQFCRLLRPVF